ncbi:MAG: ACP S-malonyltransferase [Chlamydiia bacterium]|nr:ACP S-malonyltransferase [Chlamydiia bacterium]
MKHGLAYLFPGQGAQYPGMGKEFFTTFAIARETFEEADDLLNEALSAIVFQGPEDLLVQTRYSQLGIFVTSIAIFRVIAQQMPDLGPSLCSGLSLGEYSALHASQKLGFKETLLLVRERARFMNDACVRAPGTMAAVLGLESKAIESALEGMNGVWIANYNCPGQTVISGTLEGVAKASLLLKEKGAKRVLPLSVHGAFHSGLMRSAQEALAPLIAQAPIQESQIGLVMNVPGLLARSPQDIKRFLTEQVTHSVRWEQGIRSMDSVELFLEIGCGKTLSSLNKKIDGSALTLSIDRVADLEVLASKVE